MNETTITVKNLKLTVKDREKIEELVQILHEY